jgi:hypothetical protein
MTDEKELADDGVVGSDEPEDSNKHEATINTSNDDGKDECSDLTDNNHETDEQAPKSFPQKVSFAQRLIL